MTILSVTAGAGEISAVENEPHLEKCGAHFKSYRDAQYCYRRTFYRVRLLPYRRPAAREGTGTFYMEKRHAACHLQRASFSFSRQLIRSCCIFFALFSCRSSFRAFFHFAFLYFNQAISIAMAPLGMIMKLVEPVRLGTSINRMLMTSSGQMAVPMFFR